MSEPPSSFAAWEVRLHELVDGVRERTRETLAAALARDGGASIARPVARGAGDVTFGLDVPSEEWIDDWARRHAREGPLSILTEDRGWRHLGPGSEDGEPVELDGFDHGGPRIAVDPVDGTRNLMADLRSAWTVVSFAPAGPAMPRIGDLSGGIVSELPTSRAARFRTFASDGEACWEVERAVETDDTSPRRAVRVDDDDRPDHGYFPFFRYKPDLRPAIAELEASFFERLARHEGADTRSVYDDQYISSAGHLVLLFTGTYRMLVDARALVARRAGTPSVTSKPYDVGGAVLCARAAGAVVTAADGSPLDFPMDTETPVDMAGYANERTRARLEPHWLATVRG